MAASSSSSSPMELSAPAATMKDIDLEEGGDGSGISGDDVIGSEAHPAITTATVEGRKASTTAGSDQGDVEAGTHRAGSRHRTSGVLGTSGDPMAGVGEDQKPYNYICNLDKVNLGGPGWFNDVFKISIDVDSDRTFLDTLTMSLVPRHIFRRHCKLVDTSQRITGTVTVESPPNKRVWMAGVTVTFEEHLITVDSDGGELVGALEAQVALGQYVAGKATFEFDLDLRLLESHRRWPVRETYVGELMALRHRILVGAQRPWYTFNVYQEMPLAMERLSYVPEEDAGQENEEGGPNHVLVISDCNGRCEFDFGVDSFNLGDILTGVVRFMDMASPIVAAHASDVMILKAEFMYGEASEVLVTEHTILGERRGETDFSAESGLSEEERLRMQFMSPFVAHKDVHYLHSQENGCRKEAVIGDAEISVNLSLDPLPLTPSHMSLTQDISSVTDESELVGVRYYIRLIVEDNTRAAFWHTHEIFFHRSKPSLSSSLTLDDEVDDSDREEADGVIDNENGVTLYDDNGVTVKDEVTGNDSVTVNDNVTVTHGVTGNDGATPVGSENKAHARGTAPMSPANGNMASKVSGDVR